jgi:hypothetical protein
MDRNFRPSFSNLVASLRMSFILQKELLDDVALGAKIGVLHLFAPLAERWALTVEASMM